MPMAPLQHRDETGLIVQQIAHVGQATKGALARAITDAARSTSPMIEA